MATRLGKDWAFFMNLEFKNKKKQAHNRATIKLTQAQINEGKDGCTAGGHVGKKYSKCWISCEDDYKMIFQDEGEQDSKTVEIQCKSSGKWKAARPF